MRITIRNDQNKVETCFPLKNNQKYLSAKKLESNAYEYSAS